MRALPRAIVQAVEQRGRGLTLLGIRLAAMGDILRALPALRLLRRGLPEARLLVAVDDRWEQVLSGHPDIDGLLLFPRKRLASRSPLARPAEIAAWRRRLRAEKPDLTVDFHGNLRSGLSAWLSGAPVRLGHAGHQQKEGNSLMTTHRVDAGPRRRSRIERNFDLVRALGLPVEPFPEGALPITDEARATIGRLSAELGQPHGVISPGASAAQAYKKPPAELLGAAARAMAARGLVPLVAWGPGEEPDAEQTVAASGGVARLAPPTSLDELRALIASASLFVGGDSGPTHLACALGCPVLGIYGPTDPVVNQPWGVPHVALHPPGATYTGIKKSDRNQTFAGLDGDAVEAAVTELLPAQAVQGHQPAPHRPA
ncbi:hypothetical protein ABI59_07690 [Acidobacteria bacterium Mor1]|nr:hypothetical protein ABI59_07690 [Acidobacteria bacterium Mor1]